MAGFPVMVAIFAVLMIGAVAVMLGVVVVAVLLGTRRGAGQARRVPGPGELNGMTDPLMHSSGQGHGTTQADQLIAMGIAVDSLAHSHGPVHGGAPAHGHTHDAGAGMPQGQDMSPPMHHDPGPTTMPDVSSHHHG